MKKVVALLLVFTLIAVMFTGCGGGNDQGAQSQETQQASSPAEKIMRISVSGTPKLDPAVANDDSSSMAVINLYDTLVYPQPDGTLKPQLADKWEASPDNLSYTFTLKKGVKFHNGDELTADDVVFTFNRMMTIGEGFAYLYKGIVKEATAVDPTTVKFTLTKPYALFVPSLIRLYIVNKNEVTKNIQKDGPYGDMGDYGKNWLITHDAGSGAYTVKELQQQGYMYATKFNDYWGGWDKDAPDSIKLIDNTQSVTIRTLMGNRELEITDMWQSTENLDAISKIPGVSLAKYSKGAVQYMMFNTKKAPTDDVNFRKALTYLFDYETISKKILVDSPVSAGPVSSNLPGHDSSIPKGTFDVNKAKEYLQKSKYAGQLDKYPIELLVNSDVADHQKIALAFQAAAQQAGLTVKISKAPWLSITDQVAKVETTPNLVSINDAPSIFEAGNVLQNRYSSSSTGTWEQAEWIQDKNLDAQIEEALRTPDKNERFNKYAALQQKVVNDIAPSAYLVDLTERCGYQSDYVYWPAAEASKNGEFMLLPMGYHYNFHEFKIYPDKMKK